MGYWRLKSWLNLLHYNAGTQVLNILLGCIARHTNRQMLKTAGLLEILSETTYSEIRQ